MGARVKIALGIPWASPFLYTEHAEAQENIRWPAGCEVRHIRGRGWCPARRHIHFCEQALAWGSDWLCMTGADQVHPPDLLERLYARVCEGYEVISALVPARGYVGWQDMQPFQRMAWRLKPGATTTLEGINAVENQSQEIVVVDPCAGPVQEINFIGSGVLMFHRDHLLSLKQPWFFEVFDPYTYERKASMDTSFVWRLQTEAGAHVYVDTTIQVKHLHIFAIDESYPARFADWTTVGQGDPAICNYGGLTEEYEDAHQERNV